MFIQTKYPINDKEQTPQDLEKWMINDTPAITLYTLHISEEKKKWHTCQASGFKVKKREKAPRMIMSTCNSVVTSSNQGMILNSQAVADFWRLAPCKEIPWRTRWRGWCTGTVRLQRWQSSPKRPPDPHLQCTHPLPSTWNPMWNIITIHRLCLWIEKIISASLWIMVPYLMMPVSLKAPSSEVFL